LRSWESPLLGRRCAPIHEQLAPLVSRNADT
jgi:hypothetical protein